jgi:hypothetical protein
MKKIGRPDSLKSMESDEKSKVITKSQNLPLDDDEYDDDTEGVQEEEQEDSLAQDGPEEGEDDEQPVDEDKEDDKAPQEKTKEAQAIEAR